MCRNIFEDLAGAQVARMVLVLPTRNRNRGPAQITVLSTGPLLSFCEGMSLNHIGSV